MGNLFRVHKVAKAVVPSYFIESTAPDDVDGSLCPTPVIPGLVPLAPDAALTEIATYLRGTSAPEVVITVHGFNNPASVVLERYTQAFEAIDKDVAISRQRGLVCIGYRWPSEHVNAPFATLASAAPSFLRGLFWTGLVCLLLSFLAVIGHAPPSLATWERWGHHVFYLLGLICLAVPLVTGALRIIVYFRDGYRAINYGVPDLVEVIRQLDKQLGTLDSQPDGLNQHPGAAGTAPRVKLSFIGHSMGGFVVTNAIRILSDVFSPASIDGAVEEANTDGVAAEFDKVTHPSVPPSTLALPKIMLPQMILMNAQQDTPAEGRILAGGLDSGLVGKAPPSTIGHAFELTRLILVSPDIPAETLMSLRANFLASSLLRFPEAYLFSNEGDEVLRQISTVANYFSFPTRSRKNGFRLGNTEVLANQYGLTNLKQLRGNSNVVSTASTPIAAAPNPYGLNGSFLSNLRIGQLTLADLYAQICDPAQVQTTLPQAFTYFDCTDYIENGKGVLTWAKRKTAVTRKDQMSSWAHLWLLVTYAAGQPDVHSGYFDGSFSRTLIYRLACLGFSGTLQAGLSDGISMKPLDASEMFSDVSLNRMQGEKASKEEALNQFSAACADKQIKVLLSPRAYEQAKQSDKIGDGNMQT